MCTTGGLVGDSGEFNRPGDFHKGSAFFRVGGLKLHLVEEAQSRHDEWASAEFDRIHGGPQGGRLIDGVIVPDVPPQNPFKAKELAK
jgi:hypothetical protein